MPEEKDVTYLSITVELSGFHSRSDTNIQRLIDWIREQPGVVFAQLEELEHDSYIG
jgi:hypothetical protein